MVDTEDLPFLIFPFISLLFLFFSLFFFLPLECPNYTEH